MALLYRTLAVLEFHFILGSNLKLPVHGFRTASGWSPTYPGYSVDIFGQRIYGSPPYSGGDLRERDTDSRSREYYDDRYAQQSQYDEPEDRQHPEYPFEDFNYGP